MLGMAFFKSLVKQHGVQFFEPIGKALAAAGIKKPNLGNPAHAWKLKGPLLQYSKWFAGQKLSGTARPQWPLMPPALKDHAGFAAEFLTRSPLEISGTMRKHQLKLADRQCRISELSSRLQDAVIMLCTSLYASRQQDEILQDAADVICRDLRRKLTGARVSDRDFRAVTQLGEKIADGGFPGLAGLHPDEILMPYPQDAS
jgi:hypothetical protein